MARGGGEEESLVESGKNVNLKLVVNIISTVMLNQILFIVALTQRNQQSVPHP